MSGTAGATLLRVADVVAAMERRYPAASAEPWDAVGLTCGDPDAAVRRILFAVDPVTAVVDEALEWGADLIVTHHPMFLTGVHGVAALDPKGRLVHQLISAGCALFTAHTNADVAYPGVSDALAAAIGLEQVRALPSDAETSARGALGLGRIGTLSEPLTLQHFAEHVALHLPFTSGGVRAAGDPERLIQTVAVCGGAGDSLLRATAAAGVDAYVTGDLRHHRADEHLEGGGPALVDATHFGTEWPWLVQAADLLTQDLAADGMVVDTRVSTLVTDPWTLHVDTEKSPR